MHEKEENDLKNSSRISVLREIMWRPWIAVTEGILAFIDYGDLIGKIFPSADELMKKLAILSSLSWYWKVFIIALVNIILMWDGAFRAVRKRETERDGYFKQLKAIQDATPHIVLCDPGAEEIRPGVIGASTPPTEVRFIRVRFINRFRTDLPNADALKVGRVFDFRASKGFVP